MKECTKCRVCKPLDEFYYRKDSGNYRSECKLCMKQYDAERVRKRREDSAYGEKRRFTVFRSRYPEVTCTFEEFQKARSKTHCDCCGVELGGMGERRKCVDHCHETGRIRGTLCTNCNSAEGHLKTVERVRQLLAYMENNCERS